MELTIIRHGQSENNALMENQHLRVKDPELTDVGHQQAKHTAEFLSTATDLEQMVRHPADSPRRQEAHLHGITHLYCSAMHRAMQTALPISEALGLNPSIWLDIHEHGGIWLEEDGITTGYPGMVLADISAKFPTYEVPEQITEKGWWNPDLGQEDIEGCRARAMRVKAALMERATQDATKDDHVAIVSHGTFIDCLLKAMLNNLPGEFYFYWHYNTALTRLDIMPSGTIIMRYVNRVTHLPAELVT